MNLNRDTTLFIEFQPIPSPIQYALNALKRDWERMFDAELQQVNERKTGQIRVAMHPLDHAESFHVTYYDDNIRITGHDDLGVVYGIYHVCEVLLNMDPMAFWTDYHVQPVTEIPVPNGDFRSRNPTVRFRGWFVNDEDCLMGWHDTMEISLATWEQIFESLLRAGYNTVVPGTLTQPDDPQMQLATDMGLWLTQHHAQPLGARLFRTAYPGITPHIPEDIPLFEGLYRESIEKLKDKKVLWSLGFRGQGDRPFFLDDTRYDTPQKQGKVISDMIRLQRQLIEEHAPAPHYFVHQLYSESAELYKQGYLALDDDVIRVWADNGYGAMRTRREWSSDAEIPTYPLAMDANKQSGVYYHVQFHDLQTAHRLTPVIAPTLIVREFQKLYDAGNIACVVVNTGNIRPHVFNLELISRLTRDYTDSTQMILEHHEKTWSTRYFAGTEEKILDLFYRFHRAFFPYGDHADDLGGEELCHWGTRFALRAVVRKQSVFDTYFSFPFLKERATTNQEVFTWLMDRLEAILPAWEAIVYDSHALEITLAEQQRRYYVTLMKRHIHYMHHSYAGFLAALHGAMAFMDTDYQLAFIHFSEGKAHMESAWQSLTSEDQPRWANFYRGEWLTGVRETIRWLETARGLCRIEGDTDEWWSGWMLDALGRERKVMLATTNQALTDYDRLAQALKMRREGNIMPIEDLLG